MDPAEKNIKVPKKSIRTVNKDVNDDDNDTSAWAKLLNGEGGEEENDGIHPKMEKRELEQWLEENQKSTMSSRVTLKIKSMVAAQVDRTTEQLVSNKISALVAESLRDSLQWAYEMVCTRILPAFIMNLNKSYSICCAGK